MCSHFFSAHHRSVAYLLGIHVWLIYHKRTTYDWIMEQRREAAAREIRLKELQIKKEKAQEEKVWNAQGIASKTFLIERVSVSGDPRAATYQSTTGTCQDPVSR